MGGNVGLNFSRCATLWCCIFQVDAQKWWTTEASSLRHGGKDDLSTPEIKCECSERWVKIKGIATVVFREGFCYFMCLYNGTKVGVHGPPTPFELTGSFLKFVLMSSNSSTEPLSITNSENGDNENLNQISSVSDISKSHTPYPVGGSRSDHTCI
ncbi:hypothetical protein Cgig2_033142 [Carnegiea gigantea]|uniref:Uncharacterized protein n=1 Tax=Carnegiea gigantea TaxID=171969 RepID=A0A9Q1JM57_9CARY|nr:hypothetical protein Cgig2_033142 [Carnegiea gigantea]